MPEYLVGICYHEPEQYALWKRGVIEDYESSTGLWVTANSPAEAVAWAERVGEALHRKVNADPNADWLAEYACWVEETPSTSSWSHCLDFFQHVNVGEMPPLERMGTEAYVEWERLGGTGVSHVGPAVSKESRWTRCVQKLVNVVLCCNRSNK